MAILIVPNTAYASAVSAAVELAAWCASNGLEPMLVQGDAEACDLPAYAVDASDVGEPVLAVALGGDGTILKTVHLLGAAATPVLGVKFGRLGFLSGARAEHLIGAVQAAMAGEGRIERRATLAVEVFMGGRSAGTYRALNEAVVSRGAQGRVIRCEVMIGGHRVLGMSADGVIVATATGSTAYALSAGGPIVAPGFGGMIVVPLAPHTLANRSIVTDPADVVEIVVPGPDRAEACLFVDGAQTPCRRSLDRVVVSRGEHDVAIVKLEGRDFYETVAAEFFEGA